MTSASGGIFWAPGPAGISIMPILPLGQSCKIFIAVLPPDFSPLKTQPDLSEHREELSQQEGGKGVTKSPSVPIPGQQFPAHPSLCLLRECSAFEEKNPTEGIFSKDFTARDPGLNTTFSCFCRKKFIQCQREFQERQEHRDGLLAQRDKQSSVS